MMKKLMAICSIITMVLAVGTADANTFASSTMYFQGTLTLDDSGAFDVYTGTINATAGTYYVAGGPGTVWDAGDGRWETPDGNPAAGGFDVYAMNGGTAYVQGTGSYTIGSDHDAYSMNGPWGTWYDPDVPDWNQYSLQLTADHWYLRYTSTGESPMSGAMDWSTLIATESDLGTQAGSHDGSLAHGGGAGAWDWDCGWGVEVIPLEYQYFAVGLYDLTDLEGGQWQVTISLTPVPLPTAVLLGILGLGAVGIKLRKFA